MKFDSIATFKSIHHVLKAEKILKQKGIDIDTVPVPREISADCGVAISFSSKSLKNLRKTLKAAAVTPAAICRKNSDGSFLNCSE
ncbi:MAG: DUF3343 domain-containing protein [Planctomycetota bacterium]